MKRALVPCLLISLLYGGLAPAEPPRKNPVYPPVATDVAALKAECAPFLALDEKALLDLVPPQPGFWFGDCPNCDQGSQEHQIVWTPALGERVQCQYCKHVFPSEQYPENGEVVLKTPSGGARRWRYHEAQDGARYWFEARRWHEQRKYMDQAAYDLAQLWALTKDREAGRRAALILHRFAQVYPDYIVHYDYPHRPKRFFTDGVPEGFEPYRAAKWSWWAYVDISVPLLKTYDLIAADDFLTPARRARVERELFRGMLDFVARYDGGRLTNMHPTTWTAMAVAARVLDDDALADKVVGQMGRLLDQQFFYDGFWKEGTASYHQHTVQGLRQVLKTLYPDLSAETLDARIKADYPDLARALHAADALRLPDGRFAPVRDTAPFARAETGPPAASRPTLLPGLGYAILGMGANDDQLQAHLNFTGRFGHNHYDSLGLLLYAFGKELFSDIGYTHSRARPWTTATASHNTVVVDQRSQNTGDAPDGCRGRLLLFHNTDPAFQAVAAEVPNAYPGLATTYRRCLIAVEAGGARYVVDIFDVAGGEQHDWMLHGSADEAQTLEIHEGAAALPMNPLPSLLPPDVAFVAPRNEGDLKLASERSWAYGLFRDVRQGGTGADVVATFRGVRNPRVGVRTWIPGAPRTRVTTATAWAVRGIGKGRQEDAARLDQFQRRALLIGRAGPVNRFVAVHCPFEGDAAVTRVTRLPLEPGGVALKVERAGGADYLLFGAEAVRRAGRDGARPFEFDGQAALVMTGGEKPVLKMINGTRLVWGDHVLAAAAPGAAKLLRVSGQELTVAGAAAALKPGAVVIVRHGDGATTPFHVAAVRQEKDVTVIRTQEPPALLGSADGPLVLKQFPQTTFPGPHEVVFTTFQASGG